MMTNLLTEPEFAGKTMVSRTLSGAGALRVVLFQFAAGHEMAAHRAPGELTLQFLSGTGELLAGGVWEKVRTGDFVMLGAGEEHAVRATEALTMLLTLVR